MKWLALVSVLALFALFGFLLAGYVMVEHPNQIGNTDIFALSVSLGSCVLVSAIYFGVRLIRKSQ